MKSSRSIYRFAPVVPNARPQAPPMAEATQERKLIGGRLQANVRHGLGQQGTGWIRHASPTPVFALRGCGIIP